MKKVLVVGDTILDHYVYGDVSRINPEAKHSVVLDVSEREELRLGGACNVAANIRGIFGPEVQIHYFGIVSEDILDMLSDYGVASNEDLVINDRDILLKTRYICDNHYILRVDRGQKYAIETELFVKRLKEKLAEHQYDLIVMSDYDKGTITASLSEVIVKSGIKTLVDVKKRKNLFLINSKKEDVPFLSSDEVSNSSHVILKCNASEFQSEISQSMIDVVGAVVKTDGSNGCDVYYSDERWHIPAPDVSVADVVGAGDTFIAGMAAQYLKTGLWDAEDMAEYGTLCASEKVKHFGTHVVKRWKVSNDKKEV